MSTPADQRASVTAKFSHQLGISNGSVTLSVNALNAPSMAAGATEFVISMTPDQARALGQEIIRYADAAAALAGKK